MRETLSSTTVICPKCGEVNSDNFRFCGMCGAVLEARRPAGAPSLNPLSAFPPVSQAKPTNAQEPPRPGAESAARPQNRPIPAGPGPSGGSSSAGSSSMSVPSISGPSMLGLNQPATSHSNPDQPSMELLREKSFSGLDSFFEPEQPKAGPGRTLLLLVLLAALGGAGWWIYTNYLNPAATQKPQVATSSPAAAPSDMSTTKSTPTAAAGPTQDAGSTPSAASSAAATPATTAASPVPEGPSENANPPVAEAKPEVKPEPKPASTVPAGSARTAAPKTPRENGTVAKREAIAPAAKGSPEPVATASGDADFRKGEAYLYGRGLPENCDEAVKYLKAASAESNAKARSTFGTMYATGHCVARDLPTSYQWFAMALRLDPTNQILEKDLTAIWNQMTPPERQMAARAKQ